MSRRRSSSMSWLKRKRLSAINLVVLGLYYRALHKNISECKYPNKDSFHIDQQVTGLSFSVAEFANLTLECSALYKWMIIKIRCCCCCLYLEIAWPDQCIDKRIHGYSIESNIKISSITQRILWSCECSFALQKTAYCLGWRDRIIGLQTCTAIHCAGLQARRLRRSTDATFGCQWYLKF